jgi:hypothetical protein
LGDRSSESGDVGTGVTCRYANAPTIGPRKLPAYSRLDKRQRISDLRYVDENSLD